MKKHPLTLMLVHAHPDDESIGTGGIIAKYAAEGVHTILVTCTRGELGDIQNAEFIPPRPGMTMTEIRDMEMATALDILKVGEFHCLEYRDSGMAGTQGNDDPRALARADINEAAGRLVKIIRDKQPHVVVTYDETGIYRHPDHVMAHKVTQKAFFDAGDANLSVSGGNAPWQPRKLYHIAIPMARVRRYNQEDSGQARPRSGIVGTPEETITTRIDIRPYLETKFNAIFSHKSQISADHRFRAMTPEQRAELMGYEHFVCAHGCMSRTGGDKETDLFEGLK